MTNTIGAFIKSVFPSSVDRNGEAFKALLADGEGGGAIEAIFEDLEETRAAWQDALGAYSLLEEQSEKLFGLISLLSQTDASSESIYMARNKILFAGSRAGYSPWGSAYDMRELFKAFFSIDEVWVINNCASIDESLLADGDFENEQDVWSLNGAEFYNDSAMSGNTSALFNAGGTLAQSVAIVDVGAYFLNFFLQGKARVRVTNSAGLYWKAEANGTGSWQADDAYWEFAAESWDNKQCFFALDEADTVTIEIEGLEAGTLVDYMRLHLKTATSMFAVIAGFSGGTSTGETAAYSPPKTARLGTAVAGRARTRIAGDDGDALGVNYEVMSYMDNSYVFGSSGMRSQEVSDAFLELVKPAGIDGCVEILTAETEVEAS